MLDLLNKICKGQGTFEDLANLENLAKSISVSSKCGIGQTGPLPILHALKYFKKEFNRVIQKSKRVFPTVFINQKCLPRVRMRARFILIFLHTWSV